MVSDALIQKRVEAKRILAKRMLAKGMVEGGTQPPAPSMQSDKSRFGTDDSGQNYLQVGQSSNPLGYFADAYGGGVMKGIRDLGVGVATLPFDVADYAGVPYAGDISSSISKTIPQIRQDNMLGDVVGGVTQYAAPSAYLSKAGAAFSGGNKLAQYAGGLLGGGLADFLSTSSDQASTVGDLFGENTPTSIQTNDSPLEKRMKVGVEGVMLPAAVDTISRGALGLAHGITGVGGDIINAFSPTQSRANRAAAKTVQAATESDIGDVLSNIKQNVGFSTPSVPIKSTNLSEDAGLMRLGNLIESADQGYREKGVQSIVGRQESAEKALSGDVRNTLASTGQKNEPLKTAIKTEASLMREPALAAQTMAEKGAESAAQGVKSSEADLLAIQSELGAGDVIGASKNIRSVADENLSKKLAAKNTSFESVDVGNSVKADISPLQEEALAMPAGGVLVGSSNIPVRDIGAIESTISKDAPQEVIENSALQKWVDGLMSGVKSEQPPDVTVRELVDYIPKLSKKIDDAYANNEVELAKNLTRLKDASIKSIKQTGGEEANKFAQAMARYEEEYIPAKETAEGLNALSSNAKSIDAVVKKAKVAENLDTVVDEKTAKEFIVAGLARTLNESNPSSALVNKFRNENEALLNKYPNIKADVNKVYNRAKLAEEGKIKFSESRSEFEGLIKKSKEELGDIDADIKNSSLGKMIDHDNPVEAISKVMSSKKQDKLLQVRKLVAAVKKDKSGDALEGLRETVKQWHLDNIADKKTGKIKTGDSRFILQPDVEDVYKEVFSPEDVTTLKRGLRRIQLLTSHKEVGGATRAATSEMAGHITKDTVAVLLGNNFRQYKILKSLLPEKNAEQAVLRILAQAEYDPELMKTLLKAPTDSNLERVFKLSTKARDFTRKTGVVNNLTEQDEESKK